MCSAANQIFSSDIHVQTCRMDQREKPVIIDAEYVQNQEQSSDFQVWTELFTRPSPEKVHKSLIPLAKISCSDGKYSLSAVLC